uniref:S-adenosyl-L-methionine-dependent methyltransferase n=1 Tax=Thermosporothrix sp. COM3 TaxID=2490863 RepID=A0A455SMR3_9CHLR|nr:hypothetical protein KTC_22460 [Thermosporothrix sp. COM3]
MSTYLVHDTFDTARLIAWYRAQETERPEGLFRDPYAKRLAGERGAELVRTLPQSEQDSWPIVLRTHIYDELLQQVLAETAIDTVINLAAGLDTRPYRLALPEGLRWIEVDHENVLSYKEELLAGERARCQVERVPFDITDAETRTAFLDRIQQESKQIFVLTEGLLVYLTEADVRGLATDLTAHSAIRWWLTEFISPLALRQDANRWNMYAAESVRTRFAPPGGLAFFEEYGWQARDYRWPLREMLRLKLPLRNRWLLQIINALSGKKIAPETGGFLLLERADRKETP